MSSVSSEGPRGASPGADWAALLRDLLARLKGSVSRDVRRLRELGLNQVCYIANDETDTQVSVFVSSENRQVVVSFRGTEQTKVKDILTDINFIQSAFFGEQAGPELAKLGLHSGFLRAYLSVRTALLQVLETVLCEGDRREEDWGIFVTGVAYWYT